MKSQNNTVEVEIAGKKYSTSMEVQPPLSLVKNQIQSEDNAQVILSIDELSKSHARSIELLTQEIKKFNEMLKDSYGSDAIYREQLKVTDFEKKKLKLIKDKILQLASNVEFREKLKSLKAERKEKQLSLSDYLLELERMTGANQLELFDGSVYEIVKTAKLIKKSGSHR